MTLPDPLLKWNEQRKHYDFGPIDWDEFWNVVNGNGPCNKERLAARVKAHEDGAWVREAALAYASKKGKRPVPSNSPGGGQPEINSRTKAA